MSVPAFSLATPSLDALAEVRKLLAVVYGAHALADSLQKWSRLVRNHPDYNHERHGTAATAVAKLGEDLATLTTSLEASVAEAEAAAPWAVPATTATGLDAAEFMVAGSSPPLQQAMRELADAVTKHALLQPKPPEFDTATLTAILQGMACCLKNEAVALGQLHPSPPDMTFKPTK